MNIIYNILLIWCLSFFTLGKANLVGKYCGNIFGNEINISTGNNVSNITANIFGEKLQCNNEGFIFINNSLIFSKNKSDCLNKNLQQIGGCPCPPNVKYNDKNNFLDIIGTPIGYIKLEHCY
jgi:hypothetical protein